MHTIFIADSFSKQGIKMLKEFGFNVIYKPGLALNEKIEEVRNADGLVVRSATKVTADMFTAAKKLRLVGRAGAGVDNIDLEAANRHGVTVMNTPGQNTLAAAEHAFALMISLCRNIPRADARLRNNTWDKKGLMGTELNGKTLGLIGLGRIGREVARRAKAFNMEILGFDPYFDANEAMQEGINKCDLNDIWTNSDIISLHAPFTPDTKHILSKETLAKCKDGVRVINCARGGLIEDQALANALESEKVSGAALDVFEEEPLPANHIFLTHPNVVLTPHLGASTFESQIKVASAIARQFNAFFNQNDAQFVVNKPVALV